MENISMRGDNLPTAMPTAAAGHQLGLGVSASLPVAIPIFEAWLF